MPGSNRWNRLVYAFWAPVYDLLVNAPPLRRARAQAHELLALKPGERVALIGVGTGADLEFLPEGVIAHGIDLSPAMLAKAHRKLPLPERKITLLPADAEQLPFPDQSFDACLLNLVLSVVPHPTTALQEAIRVTRPEGRLLVMDKFVPDGCKVSLPRRLLNLLFRFFGTDISRSFSTIRAGLAVEVIRDQGVMLRGHYRAILLRRSPHGERPNTPAGI